VILFGWLLFRERASPLVLIGLGLCVAGGGALLASSFRLRPAGAVGDVYGLITGVFFGLYFLAVRAARVADTAARVIFESSVITASLLLGVALALEGRVVPRSVGGVGALLALAWISHAGGQGLLAVALGRLPAPFSSLVIFLEAIAAACFAWLLLGEPVTVVQACGGLAILAGIYVARPR